MTPPRPSTIARDLSRRPSGPTIPFRSCDPGPSKRFHAPPTPIRRRVHQPAPAGAHWESWRKHLLRIPLENDMSNAAAAVETTAADRLAQIKERVFSMGQKEATRRLKELLTDETVSYFEMGALLYRHKREHWYKARDFRGFVERELREDYDRVNRVLRTYRAMDRAGLKDADTRGINFSAMYALIPVLRRGNYGEIQGFVKAARVATVSVLKSRVREWQGIPPREKKTKDDEVPRLSPGRLADFDFISKHLSDLASQLPGDWRFEWVLFDPKTGNVSSTKEELAKLVGAYDGDRVEILAVLEPEAVSAAT